jgi:hypothetical protein
MAQTKLRYSDFWDRINVDAFEEAINWTPEEQRGSNDVGFCLWPENHSNGDTTGKFAIEREQRLYNCYVCGGGTLLSLVMEFYGYDLDEATDWLYQFTEADMRSDQEFVDDFMDAFRDVEKRVNTLPYFNDRVLDKFSPEVPESWLEQRCILPEVCEQYNVRFSERIYRPAPKTGRFADDPPYEGPGIVFPHYYKGRLVGWQTRWLEDARPDWVPKYTMTTDFPKDSTIYGFDQAMDAVNVHKHVDGGVIVVESVPSALFALSCGAAAVATFGSNLNDAQMRLLRRFGGVTLAPDNDAAGEKWLSANTQYLKRYCRVWHLPPVEGEAGADLGDIASSSSPFDAFQEHLSNAYEVGVL